jgi:hypothetical protein
MAYGEMFNQVLPLITVTGSISGSFSVDPTQDGINIGVVPVDHARTVKYNYYQQPPVIYGHATITMTPAVLDALGNSVTTEVHYTFTGKNPSFKGVDKSNNNSTSTDSNINVYQRGTTAHIYQGPFNIPRNLPGSNLCVMRVRSHLIGQETNDEGVTSNVVSPNDKSQVLILKFMIVNPFPSGN